MAPHADFFENDMSSWISHVINTDSVSSLSAGGIGMVTLPGSLAQLGWTEGFGLLIIAAIAAAASLFFLDWACQAIVSKQSENGHRHSSHSMDAATTSSYAGLVAHTLGHPGSQTLEFLTLTYCLGQVIAYLGAIGGQVVSLLSLVGFLDWTIHECICGVALVVIFPLSLLPEAGAMRFAGFLGTICMIYIAGAVVLGDGIGALKGGGMCSLSDSAAAVDDDGDGGGMGSYTTLLKNAPIFLFSMNASVTYVPVRYQHRTCLGELLVGGTLSTSGIVKRESTTVIWTSILVAGFFYAVCSGVAYMAYCDQVPENVVDVWPLTWIPGSLARFFLAIELTMAAAGIYVPLGRAAFWHLLFGPFEKVAAKGATRTIVTLAFVAVSAFGSILLGGALALPLSITSALCVTAQMFVLPGLCVSTLLPGSRIRNIIPGGRMTALGFALFGGIFGILSLAALFGLMG